VDTVEIVLTADGYRYVLGIMDSFTRWIELFALTTLEAPEAANCLIQFFGRYGVPTELLSDNGSQFVNELIKAILRIVGTKQVLSLAYSKEENGRIERANKEILRHLRAFVGHSKVVDEWVIKLPFAQRIMNASVHSVTGFSPASMLFGNSIDLNRNIMPAITLRGGGKRVLNKWPISKLTPNSTKNGWINAMRASSKCYKLLRIFKINKESCT
jgi:transposase InsO family protein